MPSITVKLAGAVASVLAVSPLAYAQNLIPGGDFSAGLAAFETDYQIVSQLDVDEGTLNVFDTGDVYRTFPAVEVVGPDHTTGDGAQLVVNGSPDAGTSVLRFRANVPRAGRYTVSIYYTNTSFGSRGNDAELGILVDGSQIGETVRTRPAGIWDAWLKLEREITLAAAGPVVVEVFEASGQRSGNDFALDDFSLVETCRADLDADGVLTLFDFLAFGVLYDVGSPLADFDGDGSLTIFDFLAFQNAFDLGCP
ncbi:MAG: GC-type dockerin domain-anchored protein [Phycisphaerales bacterium]|jgi:hypothetical protein